MAHDATRITGDDLQYVDNVLAGTGTDDATRRTLLTRAAAGAAAITAAGALGPVENALAFKKDSIKTIGTTAVTAEALAVTFLSQVADRAAGSAVEKAAPVVKAANREEYIHYRVLRKAGFKPLTKRFWLPDAFFANDLKDIPAIIEIAETLFINAYLIGITTFASKRNDSYARLAGEILGVEAEHRALARSLQGKLPNNRAFEDFRYTRMSAIVKQLQRAGIGFGQEGARPGRFYEFQAPTADEASSVQGTRPR